jgi:hypothetical protein
MMSRWLKLRCESWPASRCEWWDKVLRITPHATLILDPEIASVLDGARIDCETTVEDDQVRTEFKLEAGGTGARRSDRRAGGVVRHLTVARAPSRRLGAG